MITFFIGGLLGIRMVVSYVDTSCSCHNEVHPMTRSPATLTIANFNRQTLADLLRPVLDRAMT